MYVCVRGNEGILFVGEGERQKETERRRMEKTERRNSEIERNREGKSKRKISKERECVYVCVREEGKEKVTTSLFLSVLTHAVKNIYTITCHHRYAPLSQYIYTASLYCSNPISATGRGAVRGYAYRSGSWLFAHSSLAVQCL